MEVVKKTKEYTVFKKKSGRFGVKNAQKKWVNADEKIKVLVAEGLRKAATPKPAAVEETTEAPAEESAE